MGGLSDGNGTPVTIAYRSAFFSPELGDLSAAPSPHSQKVTIHVDWQNKGQQILHTDSDTVRSNPVSAGGTSPLAGLRLVVDIPEGTIPIGIQVNGDPQVFLPGDWAHARDNGGFTPCDSFSAASTTTSIHRPRGEQVDSRQYRRTRRPLAG